jgi:hypothetical protein
MADPLTTPILRTAVNKPGTVYDALNTKRMFAEDWNAAGDALDNHEERIVDLEALPANPIKATGAEIDTGSNDEKFATPKAIADSKLASEDGAMVFTNKRIKVRTSTSASGDIAPDLASYNLYQRTAQSAAISIGAPSGTPVLGEVLEFLIKDNGTSRAISWNATYKALGLALPTATTISKRLMVTCQYDGTDWLCLFANEV